MQYKESTQIPFKRLNFIGDSNIFFCSFLLEGNENDILGLEQIPRVVDAAGLCICLQGEGKIVIEAQSYHIKKGDMCVVFPNDILQVTEKSSDFKGYTIACTPEFLLSVNIPSSTAIYLYIKNNHCFSLNEKEQQDLIRICDLLKEYDSREDHPCRDEVSRCMALAIIYEVVGIYKKREPLKQQQYSRKNQIYFEFIQLIAKNFKEHKNIEYYAGELCITSRYLSSICKEVSGMTANDCIDMQVMVNARLLLTSTDLTVQQISEELNFSNPSFFTQYFKKHSSMTPKYYRNSKIS